MTNSKKLIPALRSFSRVFTQRLKLLEDSPYDRALSLSESRILFEINALGPCLAKDLVESLSLNKGYMSRTLTSLSGKKIIEYRQDPQDRRTQWISLTARGHKIFNKINQVSQQRSLEILNAAGPLNSMTLVDSLSMAKVVLEPSQLSLKKIKLRGLMPGDLGWVISRHGEIYDREFGWNIQFEILVAQIATSFLAQHDPKKESAWIAEYEGIRLGCVFLVQENSKTAKLRILLVDPVARGLGLGSHLVQTCIDFAQKVGYSKMTLWTNDILTSARKIYESHGFVLEKSEKHQSFGKNLVGQFWARDL